MYNKLILVVIVMILSSISQLNSSEIWDVYPDTWVATDAIGRSLPTYKECGPVRQDKFVGIFYFLWAGEHGQKGPYDITRILTEDESTRHWGPLYVLHHWGEPELGYYVIRDEYVIRKHARMLQAAGVDVIFFDVTNAYTYPDEYLKLCEVYKQMRSEGLMTPQIGFLTNTSSDKVVKQLYDDFYSKGLYRDLWFMWDGKPLILSKRDGLSQNIQDFFTFRQSWAWSGTEWFGDGHDKWPWVDNYPQKPGWHEKGVPEQIPVAVAQHPVSNIGRSFHDGKQPAPDKVQTDLGLCFAEQWKRALEVDPKFIFITGWNEWVAQRFESDGNSTMIGHKVPKGGVVFIDQYNQEFSRDIEPMKGGHTDNYYYQMIAGIRKFKGVRKPEPASAPRIIKIDGNFDDWANVRPEFRDYIGDTEHRDSTGFGDRKYVDNTGRNDFVRMKVARDSINIYFYAETKDPITPMTDPNWMLLFIDSDCNYSTGWNGYDYMVAKGKLWKNNFGYNWTEVTDVPLKVKENKLELAIPKASLGIPQGSFTIDFHWADNIRQNGDIIDFSTSGDSAPDRRFNYRYIAE